MKLDSKDILIPFVLSFAFLLLGMMIWLIVFEVPGTNIVVNEACEILFPNNQTKFEACRTIAGYR